MESVLYDIIEFVYRPITLFIIVFSLIGFAGILFLPEYIKYRKSSYYKITGNSFFTCYFGNLGQKGEYLIYDHLKKEENKGARFLFNLYIPKKDGQTSEIDVLMICSDGIFVFESKNFSGWIFGDERRKNWCQIFPSGKGKSKKEFFYNPIMQNRSHIKHLKALLGDNIKMYSVIAFSDRCKLKKITIHSDNVKVIHRYDVSNAVRSFQRENTEICMNDEDIRKIYKLLYPYTQMSDETKYHHIDDIKNKKTTLSTYKVKYNEYENEENYSVCDDENGVDTMIDSADTGIYNTDGKMDDSRNSYTVQKCPVCGGDLVIRTARRGRYAGNAFYGCSNYPKCKYIKNM